MQKSEQKTTSKRKRKHNDGMVVHPSLLGKLADVTVITILIIVMFICTIPMWHTLMSSLSDGQKLMAHDGMVWWWVTGDGKPNWAGYLKTINYGSFAILKSYLITLLYVAGNVFFGLVLNVIAGYVLYRKTMLGKFLILFVLLTMMFGGGIVPTYMVIKNLGMVGTPWSLMIPGCTNAMFMILALNAFKQVPESTVEASELDGAGHFTIMFRVMLPQAKGLIIVAMINTAILSWNSWFEASIYVSSSPELWPLQLWIKKIVAENASIVNVAVPDWNKFLVSYCVILIATVPILIAMPFAQKQLQKGSFVGAVKE